MRDYRKYDVWEKGHQLTLLIYREILPAFPKTEIYDLASQLKRAAYSVPMNIAEGCGRGSDSSFVHFLDIALGSCHELEYIILLAGELGYLDRELLEKSNGSINELKAKLIKLIKTIRKD